MYRRYVLEVLVAVGLTCNVVQLVTFTGALVSECKHIRPHDAPRSVPALIKLSTILTQEAGTL